MAKKLNIIIYLFIIAIVGVIVYIFLNNGQKSVLVSKIELDKKDISLYIGEINKITPKVNPTNATNKTIKYQSNNPSIVTVDNNGVVRAKSVGESDIVVSTMDDKIKEICHVTVMVREIQKKQLSVTNMLLKVGDTKKISAYASPESPVNRKIIYKSSL